ncbi:MAG TPA: GNAT family N-acetyltransferase [Mycobacteriales bacterium]|nr:GNAT family N-acetyltransferase [Mycobacteriales bacterium]
MRRRAHGRPAQTQRSRQRQEPRVRAAVTVREAAPDDMAQLLDLWLELREHTPRRAGRTPDALAATEARYLEAMRSPGCRLVVAECAGEPIGMALLCVGTATAIIDTPAVEMTHMVVSHKHRRRGAGKALVAAAASYAEELGLDQVVTSARPQDREANRFYARLGFGPVVVKRVASVSALRRQLSGVDGRAALLRRELRVPRTAALRRPRKPVRVGVAERTES